jgi:hypothetical protein
MLRVRETGRITYQFHLQVEDEGAEIVIAAIKFFEVWDGCQLYVELFSWGSCGSM